jgi:hypothetical protein
MIANIISPELYVSVNNYYDRPWEYLFHLYSDATTRRVSLRLPTMPSPHDPTPPHTPIPPSQFYGHPSIRGGTTSHWHHTSAALMSLTNTPPPPIDPQLALRHANSDTPLSGSGSPSPYTPSPFCADPKNSGRREEFSLADLDQLLRAVIDKNPYMAPRSQIGEKWKAVTEHVQDAGFCLGRDVATLKNKVTNLLAWAEVSPLTLSIILLTKL